MAGKIYDIDTVNTIYSYGDFEYYGREDIKIGYTKEEFYANPFEILKENLGTILAKHNRNVAQMKYLRAVEKGKQDILNKTRANGDTKINNKHVTNYAWEFTNFKKGYYVGKPIKYVDLNGSNSEYDDMKYFNIYLRDCNKSSKDMIKYENMLIMGHF